MKKPLVAMMCLLFASAAWGQVTESEFFVRTVHITRIYPHELGYKVIYTTGSLELVETFLPRRWFSTAAGQNSEFARGQIIWGHARSFPYMSIFWRNGEFSHVRLYLRRDLSDPSWGVLSRGQDISGEFDVDEPRLRF